MLLALLGLALAGAPLPRLVPQLLPVQEASGPPERGCEEALAEAEARRKQAELLAAPEQEPPPEAGGGPGPSSSAKGPPTKWPDLVLDKAEVARRSPEYLGLSTPTPLEGPRRARSALRGAWTRASNGQRLRISVWGASHTAGDFFTGQLRRLLQRRWGDGGHGFVMPAALYSGDRAQDINLCRSAGWRADYVGRSNGRGDGLLGFAGASVSSGAPYEFAWVETTRSNPEGRLVSRFDIFSLGQPQGGTLLVEVDGGAARALSTRQAEPGLLWHRVELSEGPHRLTLRPMGDGEVRLLGLLAEREGGVVVDAMGVRGKQVRSWSSWEESLAGPGIAALNPDVAVLAYGTNEAHDSSFEAGRLREDMLFAIGRLRRWSPAAACVLVGPTDAAAQKGKTWVVKGRTRAVAEVQRQVAIEAGCLFWDWQAAMGGEGASVLGRLLEPPLYSSDYIHLSREGYERSAERFLEALDEAAGWAPTSP